MQKFFRDNQKKMLAIFGVLLMISFIATLGPRGTSAPSQTDFVGHIGDVKVSTDDLRQVESEWSMLSRRIVIRLQSGAPGENQWEPLGVVAIQNMVSDFQAVGQIYQEFTSSPKVLYMLQYEAKKAGLTPQYEEADKLLDDARLAIQMADGSRVPFKNVSDRNTQLGARQSLANFLMVQASFMQAIDAVKISAPMLRYDLARQFQQIKVRVVDFLAKDYEAQVGTATAEQLQKQFDRFAEFEPDAAPGTTNPFGFGYKYPNRVKLQYIAIPRQEVRKAVQAKRDDYGWDVEANRYYIQHLNEFPATQPATTGPTTALGLGSAFAPPRGPTTKPFAEVRQQILDRLIDPDTDKLQQRIQSEILAKLTQEYDAWLLAHPTTAPTSGPVTGSGTEFESFEYLQKLADGVRRSSGVTLTVASIADSFKTAAELREVKGFGQVTNLVDYVMAATEPFVPETLRKSPQVLRLFKPGRPFTDDARDVYIVRVVAADSAHRPANVDEVKDRVARDWKQSQAFDLAKADAQKLLEAARSAGNGLEPPAIGDRTVITTGAYPASNSFPIDNYKLSARGQTDFVRQTYDMLSAIAGEKSRPLSIIEMPADGKVGVAELIYVESSLRPETLDRFVSLFSDQKMREYQMALASDWFRPASIAQRVSYVDDLQRRGSAGGPDEDQ